MILITHMEAWLGPHVVDGLKFFILSSIIDSNNHPLHDKLQSQLSNNAMHYVALVREKKIEPHQINNHYVKIRSCLFNVSQFSNAM